MNERLVARIRAAAIERARDRARDAQAIAKAQHRDAPRGGSNRNRFGEARSAPGEPPAMETGRLFARLDQGYEETPEGARVPVNYRVLEFGYSVGARSRLSDRKGLSANGLQPRPLGAITLALLREKTRG